MEKGVAQKWQGLQMDNTPGCSIPKPALAIKLCSNTVMV